MDLDYNNKLKAIMAKHNTETWNADCDNDPEYIILSGEEYKDLYDSPSISPRTIKRNQQKRITPFGSGGLKMGSYKYRGKSQRKA